MGKRLLKCNLFMPASHFEVIGFFPILMSVQSNVLHYYCVTCVSMILFILFCVQLRSVNNWKTCLSLQILHFIWPGRGSWPNPGALLVWKLKKKKKKKGGDTFRLSTATERKQTYWTTAGGKNGICLLPGEVVFLFDERSWQRVSDGLHRTVFTSWIRLMKKTFLILLISGPLKIKGP